MDLKRWIDKNGHTYASFAAAAGWSNIKSWRIIEGITSPRLEDVVTIGKITKGEVSPNDILARIVAERSAP